MLPNQSSGHFLSSQPGCLTAPFLALPCRCIGLTKSTGFTAGIHQAIDTSTLEHQRDW